MLSETSRKFRRCQLFKRDTKDRERRREREREREREGEREGETEGRKISLFLAIARETNGGGTVARRTRIHVYVYTYRIARSVPHYGKFMPR